MWGQAFEFDFTHFQAVSPAELAAIEEEVNRQVLPSP